MIFILNSWNCCILFSLHYLLYTMNKPFSWSYLINFLQYCLLLLAQVLLVILKTFVLLLLFSFFLFVFMNLLDYLILLFQQYFFVVTLYIHVEHRNIEHRKKRDFKVKQKAFFTIFKAHLVAQSCLSVSIP